MEQSEQPSVSEQQNQGSERNAHVQVPPIDSIDPAKLEPVVRREIRSHVVNLANDTLKVEVLDDPGSGGANHLYRINGFDPSSNKSDPIVAKHGSRGRRPSYTTLLFQNGPINEVGVNGITHETLLAVLIDRLEAFQAGPFACSENEHALKALLSARDWLATRTKRRTEVGIEGTHQPDHVGIPGATPPGVRGGMQAPLSSPGQNVNSIPRRDGPSHGMGSGL